MTDCIVLSEDASQLGREILRMSVALPTLCICRTVDEALHDYSGQEIVLGDPDLVAAAVDQWPEVKWVQSTWAGVTPLVKGVRRDYVLTNVRTAFGPQLTEYVFGYLLAHELRLLERSRRQQQREWYDRASGTLQGKRLAIMGTGSIGTAIATAAAQFDMQVVGLSRSGLATHGFVDVFSTGQIEQFLADADYLISTLPQTAATDGLLNEETLKQLPKHAYLINIGRGNVVDDSALVQCLRAGRLAGAVLDVFDEEPIAAESELWDTPNLLVTAHIAALSHASLIAPIFVDNYHRYMKQETLQNVVDWNLGY